MLSVRRLALNHCRYEATQYGHQGSRKAQLELREEIHTLGHRKKAAGIDSARACVAIAGRAAAAAGRVVAYAQAGCRVAGYTEELSAGTSAVTLVVGRAAEAASPLAQAAASVAEPHLAPPVAGYVAAMGKQDRSPAVTEAIATAVGKPRTCRAPLTAVTAYIATTGTAPHGKKNCAQP